MHRQHKEPNMLIQYIKIMSMYMQVYWKNTEMLVKFDNRDKFQFRLYPLGFMVVTPSRIDQTMIIIFNSQITNIINKYTLVENNIKYNIQRSKWPKYKFINLSSFDLKNSQKMIQNDHLHLQQRIEEQQRIAKVNEALIRFLQLSLQLFFQWGFSSFGFLEPFKKIIVHQTQIRYHYDEKIDSRDFYTKIVQPLCLIWTLYNFFVLIAIKCIDQMNNCTFIATGIINYLVSIIIVIIGFIQDPKSDNASKQIYHRYTPFQVMNCLVVVSFFYFTNASEPRRFSNSPGNFVWVWLFLTWKWQQDITGYMYSIGVIYLVITFMSVLMLFLQIKIGLTACLKKAFIIQWIFSLILTILTEIFAIVSHSIILKIRQNRIQSMLEDSLAVGLLQIFIIVNILDMVFWVVGGCMM